jgi:hypothetical protein
MLGLGCANICRGFIRGGNWNNTTNAGAFTLNLNNTPTNTNNNIGFRVARSFTLHQKLVLMAFGSQNGGRLRSPPACPKISHLRLPSRFAAEHLG